MIYKVGGNEKRKQILAATHRTGGARLWAREGGGRWLALPTSSIVPLFGFMAYTYTVYVDSLSLGVVHIEVHSCCSSVQPRSP